MTWWEGAVLGVVQGLTEFLPISSSGHLVVAQAALDIRLPGVLVEVVVHVATLLAVVIVYWARLAGLVRGAFRGEREAWRYIGLLVIATIPAVIVGGVFGDIIEESFESLVVVGIDFILTGTILWSTRWAAVSRARLPTPGAAGAIGVGQAAAILPGISRSGTTVAVAMWLGLDGVRAAEFSFLMAIPAIAGAATLQLRDLPAQTGDLAALPLAVAFVTSLVAGVFAIRLLVRLLTRGAFHRFAPYCWALGAGTLAWILFAR